MVFEVKIIKQELEFEECLKQRLEFICEFSKVTPTFLLMVPLSKNRRTLEKILKKLNRLVTVRNEKFRRKIQTKYNFCTPHAFSNKH